MDKQLSKEEDEDPPEMSRSELRAQQKQQQILEAATALFLEKGYDLTTMDDVANRAGVSKATVYKHVADKERLYAEVVEATIDQIAIAMHLVADTLAADAEPAEALALLARKLLQALLRPQMLQLRRMVIAQADRFPAVGRAWYERGFGRVIETLAAGFERMAQRSGLVLPDPVLAAHHFAGLLLWIPLNRAMFTGEHRSSKAELERYADAAVAAFLAAYGAPTKKHPRARRS